MKVDLKGKAKSSSRFPKLMTDGILIVLFTEPCCGMCLTKTEDTEIHHSSYWNMQSFVDCTSEVTISND